MIIIKIIRWHYCVHCVFATTHFRHVLVAALVLKINDITIGISNSWSKINYKYFCLLGESRGGGENICFSNTSVETNRADVETKWRNPKQNKCRSRYKSSSRSLSLSLKKPQSNANFFRHITDCAIFVFGTHTTLYYYCTAVASSSGYYNTV